MFTFVSPQLPSRPPSRLQFHPRSINNRRPLLFRRNAISTVCTAKESGSSKSETTDGSLPLNERLRLLVDPTLNSSARQVLAIDLLADVPKLISKLTPEGRPSPKNSGLSDVARQLREDIIPDLVNNGPKYVTRAIESIPSPASVASSGPPTPQSPMPPVQLSPSEVTQEVSNVFRSTPDGLYTPNYEVLMSGDGFEVRRYPSLILAQTKMASGSNKQDQATELEYASAMGSSFGNLAGYLFGKNKSNNAMKMTTPVVLDSSDGAGSSPAGDDDQSEVMSFIIGEYQNLSDVPVPEDGSVQVVEVPGGVFAAAEFSGYVTKGEARRQSDRIVDLVQKSQNVQLESEDQPDFKFLIYNPPYTLPNLRRNEVLVAVSVQDDGGDDGSVAKDAS